MGPLTQFKHPSREIEFYLSVHNHDIMIDNPKDQHEQSFYPYEACLSVKNPPVITWFPVPSSKHRFI